MDGRSLVASRKVYVQMAERVEEMPVRSHGGNASQVYPWAEWLDGSVWKLTQSVSVEGADGVVVVTDGDFSVKVEKMRSYAKNAGARRGARLKVTTRSHTEVGKLADGTEYKYAVMFVQGFPLAEEAGEEPVEGVVVTAPDATAAATVVGERLVAAEDGEQLAMDLGDGAVENPGTSFVPGAAPAGLAPGDEILSGEAAPLGVDVAEEGDDTDPDGWEEVQ